MYNRTYNAKQNNGFIPVPKEPHNKSMKNVAEGHAFNMRKTPTYIEKRMMELLDSWKVKYEFQKVFYITSSGGFIKHYYIVDFYIPSKNLIIETGGKYGMNLTAYEVDKIKSIRIHYHNMNLVKWGMEDFRIYKSLKDLKALVGK